MLKIKKQELIQLIKEEYSYIMILEAQNPHAVASAIANYIRIKHKTLSDMNRQQALNIINDAVFDMMKVKDLGGVDTQKLLIVLTVRDLMKTGDLKLDQPTAQKLIGAQPQSVPSAPMPPPQAAPAKPGVLGRINLKKIFKRPHP